jgi:hypothetical protein
MPVRDEPPVPEQIERMRRELGEVKEAAMRAANEGRERDAAELQQRARELGMGIEKATAEFKKRDIAQKVRQLRWMAAQAKQAGDNERAEKMVREADDLQRRLQNAPEPRKQPTPEKRQQRPSPERQQQDEVRRAIMELRGEVVRLRDQVEQLKREVRR